MVATWNPAANAAYYSKQTAYYAGESGVEPPGIWYAPGSDLSLTDGSIVEPATFERLFAGLDEQGNSLMSSGRGLDRVPAFDITFSAPRSVSLIWALGDQETRHAIEAAHAHAVRQTLILLEQEAAFARRGRGGARIEKVALSAASFRHGESRPAEHTDGVTFADPNLHTHCVVINLATRADGTVGALHSTVLRDWKMAAGAAYHAALAAGVIEAGLEIDRLGKNGIFEVAGIDPDAITYFSARRQEIVEELAEAGVEGSNPAALAAAIAKITRASKSTAVVSREEAWSAAARRIGLDTGTSLAGAIAPVRDRPNPETILAERLAALPDRLTETKSVLERREIVRAVAEALVGTGFGPECIDSELARLFEAGRFMELGRDRIGLPRYSTPEIVRIEREIVDMAAAFAATPAFAVDEGGLEAACHRKGLSDEQRAAVRNAAQPARIAVIEGAPGTGKTTLLAPLVTAWTNAGYRVVGAATAWRVANALADELGIESRATASWLARSDQGLPLLDAKSVLVVDEAGLLSSREMHALLAAAKEAGAKVLFTGDRNQLQAIGAGSGLKLVTHTVEAARVETIVRQKQVWARDAVTAFGRGDAEAALDAFAAHNLLVEATGHAAAITAAVDHVEDVLVGSDPASTLILARTNAEIAAIGREVRNRLRSHGLITGEDVAVDAVTPSGHTVRLSLAVGDRIRFLVRNDRLGVINGTVATVTKITPVSPTDCARASGGRAIVEARIGDRLVRFDTAEIADSHGRARLGWAYASTVYASQGMTVDRAAVLLTPGYDRHDIYVAASRARIETVLVTDDRRIAEEMAAAGSSVAADDNEARRQWLAKRLSAAHVKETTLDFARIDLPGITPATEIEPAPEQSAIRDQDRRQQPALGTSREVGHEL